MSGFSLPDLGEGLTEAEIVSWHVSPGDSVVEGQPLVSVETDKAVVEIPSPRSGRVGRLHGAAGDRIEVGTLLVDFDDGAYQEPGALVGQLPGHEPAKPEVASTPPSPAGLQEPTGDERVKAAPAVRAAARARGIDLARMTPTGPDGQVVMADLDRAAAQEAEPSPAAALEGMELMRGPRRAMARNMSRAHAAIVPATVTDVAVADHLTPETDVTVRLIRAIAAGCVAAPALNAWLDPSGERRRLNDRLDLGIAMDSPDGLFVPVLRDAGGRDAGSLRQELNHLKDAVAARTVTPDMLRGATFTLSNFGTLGGRFAALVVMPPQVAILGAGRGAPAVVAVDGAPAVRRTLPLSLTFDHRAVTGGEAARFLAAVIADLEQVE